MLDSQRNKYDHQNMHGGQTNMFTLSDFDCY